MNLSEQINEVAQQEIRSLKSLYLFFVLIYAEIPIRVLK